MPPTVPNRTQLRLFQYFQTNPPLIQAIAAGLALTGSSCSPANELADHLLELLVTRQI